MLITSSRPRRQRCRDVAAEGVRRGVKTGGMAAVTASAATYLRRKGSSPCYPPNFARNRL